MTENSIYVFSLPIEVYPKGPDNIYMGRRPTIRRDVMSGLVSRVENNRDNINNSKIQMQKLLFTERH